MYVFSGATRAVIRTLDTPNFATSASFGNCVVPIASVDADTVPDLLVGSPDDKVGSIYNSGRVYIFRSNRNADRYAVLPKSQHQHRRQLRSGCLYSSEYTADGVADFAVGAPNEDVGSSFFPAGRVYVLNGATHAVLRTLEGTGPSRAFGGSLAVPGNFAEDGAPELGVGINDQSSYFRVDLFNLTNGNRYAMLTPPHVSSTIVFRSVAAVGDINGDSIPDLVIGTATLPLVPELAHSYITTGHYPASVIGRFTATERPRRLVIR